MLRMIAVPGMRHRAWALDGLPAACGGAERVVGLVVVVCAEGLAVVDVKGFVWEGFLRDGDFRVQVLLKEGKDELGMYGN